MDRSPKPPVIWAVKSTTATSTINGLTIWGAEIKCIRLLMLRSKMEIPRLNGTMASQRSGLEFRKKIAMPVCQLNKSNIWCHFTKSGNASNNPKRAA